MPLQLYAMVLHCWHVPQQAFLEIDWSHAHMAVQGLKGRAVGRGKCRQRCCRVGRLPRRSCRVGGSSGVPMHDTSNWVSERI